MASTAYYNWIAAGRPYRLALWMRDIQATLRGRGFVVYDYPDDDHLMADNPLDHTPFSYSGWPLDSPFGWGHALDVMPLPGTDARALAPLARQIIADKDAGHPALAGLKYINWTDESGSVRQTSWKPTKATQSSTDKGHVHLSGRSDSRDWRALGYDPIARMNGAGDVTPEEINTIVRQVVNALINESTDAGYVAGAPNDPLNRSIAGSMNRTIGDLHAKVDALTAKLNAAQVAITPAQLDTLSAAVTRGIVADLGSLRFDPSV